MDYIIHEFVRRLGDWERSKVEEYFYKTYSDEAKQIKQAMAQRKFDELNPPPTKTRGRDFYSELAARYFGIPVEQVTTDQRERVKHAVYIYRYYYGNK